MDYVKITPSLMRTSLRELARGKEPRIEPCILADYILHHGSFAEMAAPTSKNDFVSFAENLFALKDSRQPEWGEQ
jgi:hypothetical protein